MKIWFISTRIAGNDGVSLEAVRWKQILKRMGHRVNFVAGELDGGGILIPELHFAFPQIAELYDRAIYKKELFSRLEKDIFDVAKNIENKLVEELKINMPDLIIVANVFSLPMNFPLAVALSKVIDGFKIPTIARHHDFWWERDRFLRQSWFPFFRRWFPPDLTNIRHVVINSDSQKELAKRTGILSTVISDCFDFESNLNQFDSYSKSFRKNLGINSDDIVFLQATRIVPRKRIELSIKLLEKLDNPKAVLVIAGHSGDEGAEYESNLRKLASNSTARILFVGENIDSKRRIETKLSSKSKFKNKKKIYTLWDAFVNSDFVTYPTMLEGFGNQFIESVYFKKPIIVTPYPVYEKDIKPLGFETIEMDENIKDAVLQKINFYIKNLPLRKKMVEKNFKLGKKYFSYEATEKKIRRLLRGI